MADAFPSFTVANNPAGTQINNGLFLCAVFHTLLYVTVQRILATLVMTRTTRLHGKTKDAGVITDQPC